MTLDAGTRLGAYEILTLIGSGGIPGPVSAAVRYSMSQVCRFLRV